MADRRVILGLRWKDLAVLFGYLLMLCFAVSHYQPWEDEGRAWMDARTSSLYHLTFHLLRYEGHPALWYWILWVPSHLQMPFVYVNWISASIAACGIYLLLRYSPFPFCVNALLPFGFALGYEYAVVARSYVLFPLLGFWVAHLFRQRVRRPMAMAVALSLFANVSIHATIVAICFAAAYAWDAVKDRRRSGLSLRPDRPALNAAAVFAASLLFVAICVWPPHDLIPPVGPKVNTLFRRLIPASYSPVMMPGRMKHAKAHILRIAEPATPAPAQVADKVGMTLVQRLRLNFVYPISAYAPLALVLYALVSVYLFRRASLLLILAPVLLGLFLVGIYTTLWHTGLMWITLLMVLWAAWDQTGTPTAVSLQNGVAILLGLLCLLQLPWTLGALRYETTHSTYPAEATANYLKTLPHGKRIDGYDHSFTVEPYFSGDILHKYNKSLDNVSDALSDHPDVIVLRETSIPAAMMDQLLAAGYLQTHSFCGSPYFPNQRFVPTCLVVLEKT